MVARLSPKRHLGWSLSVCRKEHTEDTYVLREKRQGTGEIIVGGSPGADTGGPEIEEGTANSKRGSDERTSGAEESVLLEGWKRGRRDGYTN